MENDLPKSPIPLKSYLELCERLGIRYLPPDFLKFEGPAPSKKPVQKEAGKKNLQPPAVIPKDPGNYHPAYPKWLTTSHESISAMELMAFDKDICGCQKCPLRKTRRNFVFGSGNPQAEVMFVGEGPGADEDAQGLPFVGAAGRLLTKIVESTKTWKRSEVFICNVLKCRPPGNRTPLPEEVDQCRPHLEEQIRIIHPKFIMALGATAAQALLRTKDSVGKLRNKWHDLNGIPLRVTYHPAALLRYDGYKKDVWEDMKELTDKFNLGKTAT